MQPPLSPWWGPSAAQGRTILVQEDAVHDEDTPLPGPGTGGSPAPTGLPDADDRAEAAADPEVAGLVEELRSDDGDVQLPVADAAEQVGTGTDR
jgi:hypothetical protein